MVTLKDLKALLEETGLPVAYGFFRTEEAPDLPFLVYQEAYSNNFAADNVVYQKIAHIQIDLFTKWKEPQTEGKVENALSSFVWEKAEEYDDAEKVYRITYEIEV